MSTESNTSVPSVGSVSVVLADGVTERHEQVVQQQQVQQNLTRNQGELGEQETVTKLINESREEKTTSRK
jgi:hypothetical protein